MDPGIWKEAEWKDAHKKTLGSYNRSVGRFCTEKRKSVSIIEGEKRRGTWVYIETIEKGIYWTLKVKWRDDQK